MKFLAKNTKIVSTFGPAITENFSLSLDRSSPEIKELTERVSARINDLFFSGVNCVRFNFSHGSKDENDSRLFLINEVQKKIVEGQKGSKYRFLRPIVCMADTKGPEIRVFDMTFSGIFYKMGQIVNVNCKEKKQGSQDGFSVMDSTGTYNMANDCVVGNVILVEDGKLTLEILEVDKESGIVKAKVKNDYLIKTNKRINLPGADYSMKFLSDKDISDIEYALDKGFEFAALSFANCKEDVNSVRDLISSYCKEKNIPNIMKVYSKIEALKACEKIDEVISASDGIMIARGDLGLEIPYFVVPYWTKEIIKRCRKNQKPVITATQMLDSLERNVLATRAEVSDVYRAAEMGSDCTMLSGETAQGMFPCLAVKTMSNIVFESEKHFNHEKFLSFFKEDFYSSLSSEVKNKCHDLLEILGKNKRISAVVVFDRDVNEEFCISYSSMRLAAPLYVFVPSNNIEDFCGEPKWDSEDYVKMKKLSSMALFRGINLVFFDGKTEETNLSEIFNSFISKFSESKTYTHDFGRFLCLDGSDWRINGEG